MEAKHSIGGEVPTAGRPFRSTPEERLYTNAGDALLERVEQYEMIGSTKPDPFEKFSSLVQGEFFRNAYSLLGTALRVLAGDTTGKSLSAAELPIQRYLGVTRRIAKFAQLEVRAGESRKSNENC